LLNEALSSRIKVRLGGPHRSRFLSKNARRFTRRRKQNEEVAPTKPPVIELTPKTPNQKVYATALNVDPVILVTGCAGTGKTYMAATQAAKMYQEKYIDKIIITRPNVAVSNRGIGFFPGTLEEKMAPWVAPIIDVFIKHLGKGAVDTMVKHGAIKIEPFETLRGRSFEDAFIILDEAQNCTYEELKLFLTRLGENSTTVINGDIAQTDLAHNSGLRKIIHIVKSQMLPYPVIEFTVDDIVRSDVCATWIKAFDKYEKESQ
jgi:phosphate starvation-inducible PhoH-like protein